MTDADTPAVAALREHIREHYGGSVNKFARENKLDAAHLSKVMSGARGRRISVELATRIEQATRGAVRVGLWSSSAEGASE